MVSSTAPQHQSIASLISLLAIALRWRIEGLRQLIKLKVLIKLISDLQPIGTAVRLATFSDKSLID
jgi:hypothetical protein